MGKFNKTFNEYSKDNFISAEELQELAKQYSTQSFTGRPGADNNYNKEFKLTDEKAFWKKFKENYKKSGGESLGVAGVAGRVDREKLITAYNNPQYGPPAKPEEKKEDFSIPEARDYNLDFSSQSFKMEELDGLKEYDTDETRKEINSIERSTKDPGTFKSYLDRLRGNVTKPNKIKANKELARDIKKNKKQIKKRSAFNPDPIKMTSFLDASMPVKYSPKYSKSSSKNKPKRMNKNKGKS